jgi:hypothetical protein
LVPFLGVNPPHFVEEIPRGMFLEVLKLAVKHAENRKTL